MSAAATAISAILLAAVFHLRLCKSHAVLVQTGTLMFALGLGSALAIGVLAPFTRGYSPVHIQLTYAAFIGIWGGTFFDLIAARGNWALLALQGGVLLFLVYLYFVPDFFNNDRRLSTLAFWEWMLSVGCWVGLWTLAGAVEALGETASPGVGRA